MNSQDFNFAKVSNLDETVYGASRPGRALEPAPPTLASVEAWCDFMKTRAVTHVLCLLGDKHLSQYEACLPAGGLCAFYEARGLAVESIAFVENVDTSDVVLRCLDALWRCHRLGQKVLALHARASPSPLASLPAGLGRGLRTAYAPTRA